MAVLALCAGLAGCTQANRDSFNDGLWYMFAGHPKPIILRRPPPPVYCSETIGEPDCYAEPE